MPIQHCPNVPPTRAYQRALDWPCHLRRGPQLRRTTAFIIGGFSAEAEHPLELGSLLSTRQRLIHQDRWEHKYRCYLALRGGLVHYYKRFWPDF